MDRTKEFIKILKMSSLPAAPLTGLQRALIIIIEGFLVHLDQFLPLYFSTDNFVKVLGSRGERPPLLLGEFLLLSFPFLLTARQMDPNTPGAEVSATDVAGDRHCDSISEVAEIQRISQIRVESRPECLCR